MDQLAFAEYSDGQQLTTAVFDRLITQYEEEYPSADEEVSELPKNFKDLLDYPELLEELVTIYERLVEVGDIIPSEDTPCGVAPEDFIGKLRGMAYKWSIAKEIPAFRFQPSSMCEGWQRELAKTMDKLLKNASKDPGNSIPMLSDILTVSEVAGISARDLRNSYAWKLGGEVPDLLVYLNWEFSRERAIWLTENSSSICLDPEFGHPKSLASLDEEQWERFKAIVAVDEVDIEKALSLVGLPADLYSLGESSFWLKLSFAKLDLYKSLGARKIVRMGGLDKVNECFEKKPDVVWAISKMPRSIFELAEISYWMDLPNLSGLSESLSAFQPVWTSEDNREELNERRLDTLKWLIDGGYLPNFNPEMLKGIGKSAITKERLAVFPEGMWVLREDKALQVSLSPEAYMKLLIGMDEEFLKEMRPHASNPCFGARLKELYSLGLPVIRHMGIDFLLGPGRDSWCYHFSRLSAERILRFSRENLQSVDQQWLEAVGLLSDEEFDLFGVENLVKWDAAKVKGLKIVPDEIRTLLGEGWLSLSTVSCMILGEVFRSDPDFVKDINWGAWSLMKEDPLEGFERSDREPADSAQVVLFLGKKGLSYVSTDERVIEVLS
jgi:hypothetical protein